MKAADIDLCNSNFKEISSSAEIAIVEEAGLGISPGPFSSASEEEEGVSRIAEVSGSCAQ